MPVLDIPNVVVLESVHVYLELSVRIQVHVGDEENVRIAVCTTIRRIFFGLNLIRDL